MTEEVIINKILQGDRNYFALLVDKYKDMVFRTCMGYLHNKENAEDVAQEVFISLFDSLHTFRKESKISTWLYRVSANKSMNYIRDNKKRQNHVELSPTHISNHIEETQTEDMEGMIAIVQTAIDNLPDKQKKAFVLHKYNDLPYKQIAVIMDISLSAVESLIFRAKRNIEKEAQFHFKKHKF